MTYKQALSLFTAELISLYEREELFTCFLIVSALSRSDYIIKQDQFVVAGEFKKITHALKALKTGMPVQYVMGEAYFYGLKFKVTPHVLIPRPETEELVDWIVKTVNEKWLDLPVKILDIGTGSGCIPIVLSKNIPLAKVSALDVSRDAVNVARQNDQLNNAAVSFIEADIFSHQTPERYDIIVSNPPYITTWEKDQMHKNVLEFEPHLALFVEDEDPLKFYRAISAFAVRQLNKNGMLFFEINANFGQDIINMLAETGFKDIVLKKDMQGLDRMISASITSEAYNQRSV